MNLDCRTILNLHRGANLNLDCATILNLDCGTLLNLKFRTLLNYKITFITLKIHTLKIIHTQKTLITFHDNRLFYTL